jgi:hypothetical protein
MKTNPAPPPNSLAPTGSFTVRREAQMAYQAGTERGPKKADEDALDLALRGTNLETPWGATVLLSAPEEPPRAPMFLLSATLLRTLLGMAGAARPARPGARRRRRRLDITV